MMVMRFLVVVCLFLDIAPYHVDRFDSMAETLRYALVYIHDWLETRDACSFSNGRDDSGDD
jgi:hypothetical protein